MRVEPEGGGEGGGGERGGGRDGGDKHTWLYIYSLCFPLPLLSACTCDWLWPNNWIEEDSFVAVVGHCLQLLEHLVRERGRERERERERGGGARWNIEKEGGREGGGRLLLWQTHVSAGLVPLLYGSITGQRRRVEPDQNGCHVGLRGSTG